MKKLFIIVFGLFLLAGCKDASRAQFFALGSKHIITVWSGGKAVAVYESTGNVSNQEQTDGWYFEDAKTKKLVEIAGTITIEQE